jgi:uncharacterized protein (DUF2235 family)
MNVSPIAPSRPATDHPALPRDLCVFIDGTWDDDNPRDLTNVRILFDATPDGVVQGRNVFPLYLPGVGAKPRLAGSGRANLLKYFHGKEPWDPLRRKALGGLVGKGTRPRIKAAYHFVCDYYRRGHGDRLFIFGFSRGAFAARSLAGFLATVGLLLADKLGSVERAYEIYESSTDPAQTELRRWLRRLTREVMLTPESIAFVPVHFLGVWDTVACLGLPWRKRWENAPFTEHRQLAVPPNVVTARHALAVHELRPTFEPLLWHGGTHTDLQQMWFTGAHADVGGGYPAREHGLSDIALRWMASESRKQGLQLRGDAAWLADEDEAGRLHHEIRGKFLFTTPRSRSWLLPARTPAQDYVGHCFHPRAIQYLADGSADRYEFALEPVNLALRRVDEHALVTAVLSALFTRGVPAQSSRNGSDSGEPGSGWWSSVTAQELRAADGVVRTFLAATGAASDSEVEAFARALALRELLVDANTVLEASRAVGELLASFDVQTLPAVDAAERWALRGDSIARGLSRCLELMAPHAPQGQQAVTGFAQALGKLKLRAGIARLRVGTGREIPVGPPIQFKPRKRFPPVPIAPPGDTASGGQAGDAASEGPVD